MSMPNKHIDQVNLNLLPPLVALLEERHVSRAAERLRLSQPAMSRALQQLRRSFGDELLVRGPDGYTLTPRAQRIRWPTCRISRSVARPAASGSFR